jgi:methyltransferase (TIGR00027 family)
MREGQPSRTAERVAVERAAHQILDSPLVLVDPLAILVIGSKRAAALRAHPRRHDASLISRPTRAIVVVRGRIAEDEIARRAAKGPAQYVLLGAGLDTFGYRNPHPTVRVFEVDHPATQRLKRERLAAAGIPIPPALTYVPCDFARDRLPDVLNAGGFDRSKPTVFAWLGVAMYLEPEDVRTTLGFIASLPTPASLVFDYVLPPRLLPWFPRMLYRHALKRLERLGEPWRSFLEPGPLRAELRDIGFADVEDLGADDINRGFLANRSDGLKVAAVGHIVIARVAAVGGTPSGAARGR